jgi:hypothetical protein
MGGCSMSLIDREIRNSYKDLILVNNNNAGVDGTLRPIVDGEGTQSALEVSQTGVKVQGNLEVTGDTTGLVHPEVYGFKKDINGNLIVTTTNDGQDNISEAQFDEFDEALFSCTGFTFSLTSNGNLMATI